MNAIIDRIRREPVLVTALVQTGLLMLAAFGLELDPAQMAAVLAFTGAILAIVARQQVTPTVDVGAERPGPNQPLEAGPASDVPDGDEVEVIPAEDHEPAVEDDYFDPHSPKVFEDPRRP